MGGHGSLAHVIPSKKQATAATAQAAKEDNAGAERFFFFVHKNVLFCS